MGYKSYSGDSNTGEWIFGIIITISIIFATIQLIKSDIENIIDILSNGWSWVLAFSICSIISGVLLFYYRNKIKKQNDKQKKSEKENYILAKEIVNLKDCIIAKDDFYNSMSTLNEISIKHLTELVSDLKLVEYDISAKFLRTKKHPAHGEAQRINELKKETKLYHEQYKQMLYKYEALIGLFPELSTYIEDFESIKELNDFRNLDNLQSDYDRVRDFISKDEYIQLNINEKNQLALNRYITGKKSKWQIGRDYEMYIAYLYRSKGWKVIQYGIEKKLEDMGRDLIVFSKDEVLIVQCKYWSETKLIHEKHIAQLYGSTVEYALFNSISIGNVIVRPVFITNIELSETAKQFAKTLKVTVCKINLGAFPRIKCNVNNNDKIYHLPFDQQYDRTKIENKDEMYALSIKEAVDAGFRRALKFYGNN